jgi:ubiquinone/menaquinone biosynthesis C-methylase UbiE
LNENTCNTTKARGKAQIIKEEVGKNHKILDVGCGGGPYANFICKENDVYASDECTIRLLLDEDNALSKGYSLLSIGDGLQLPFADSFFDIVLCTEVLEHTLETRAFVKELYSFIGCLKQTGFKVEKEIRIGVISERFDKLFSKIFKNYADDLLVIASKQNSESKLLKNRADQYDNI